MKPFTFAQALARALVNPEVPKGAGVFCEKKEKATLLNAGGLIVMRRPIGAT